MSQPGQSEKARRDRAFELDALPWIDAVYRLALSLTGDEAAASDMVEDTYLRAYESWPTYVPGSDCRRWLLAICRDVFLRSRQDWPTPDAGSAPRRDALAVAREFWAEGTSDGGRDDAPARRNAPQPMLPSPLDRPPLDRLPLERPPAVAAPAQPWFPLLVRVTPLVS